MEKNDFDSFGIFQDDSKEKLAYLALVDDLTGLYNRRYFYQILPQIIVESKKTNSTFCLSMMDIDKFKQINDSYGHLRGDDVLSGIASLLKKNVRKDDIVARYAGDEFIIIFPNTDPSEAYSLASSVLTRVREHIFPGDPEVNVTLSLGISNYPGDATSPRELVEKADVALYSSKNRGKDIVSLFSKIKPIHKSIPKCPTFINQTEHIGIVKDLVDLALQKKGSTFLLTGEHGVGKSEFLKQCITIGEENLFLSLKTIGNSTLIETPYYFFSKIIGNYIKQHPSSKATLNIVKNFGNHLKDLIPEVEISQNNDFTEEKIKLDDLVDIFLKSLTLLAEEKPLMICLDDFHFSDTYSINIFLRLTESISSLPIIIACSYSLSDHESFKPFSKNISALKRATTEEIKLNNFTFSDFQFYLKNIFKDTTVKEAYAEKLFSVTKGNPLFSQEILKLLFNENIIIHTGDKWELKDFDINKLPKTIGEAIKKRYQHFDKDTKNALARAAAIGEEIDFRILKESGDINEGKLLDLIDFAKNEGLLQEKEALSDDSLNFSSPEIRETLYELIEEKDKKEIHETIGEVVENIFSQKITEFLPYLAYQYSMSGNAKKAAEASSRYINNFTPGKLTKEKRKTVPLDDSSFEALVDFLRYLRAAYINIQLYPPASHLITDSIDLVLSKLQPVFEKRDSITVSETEKRLIVEGKSIEESGRTFVAAFLNLLVSHGLKSITFQKNVTLKEIANFLNILKEKPESIKLKGGILKLMKHGEVKNITVNEKIYIIVGEDEELQTTLAPDSSSFPGVDLQKKDIPIPMDTTVTSEIPTMPDIDFSQFTRVFNNISSKPDEIKKVFEKQNDLPPELIKKINFEITKTLSSLDTGRLTELISNLSKDNMDKEVKSKVFKRISKDKIFSLLDAIIKDLKAIKHKELDIGKEKGLKSILKDIINISKEKNILPDIYNKLAEGNLVKKRKPIDKHREIVSKYLSMTTISLSSQKEISNFIDLIKDLLKDNQTKSINSLVAKIFNESKKDNLLLREKSVGLLNKLTNLFIENQFDSLEIYSNEIIEVFKKEKQEKIAINFSSSLMQLTTEKIKKADFENSIKLVNLIKSKFSSTPNLIIKILSKIKENTFETLIDDLKSRNEEIQKKTADLCVLLGESIAPDILHLILTEDNINIFKAASDILVRIGEDSLKAISNELNIENNNKILSNLLDLLVLINSPKLNNQISLLLSSTNAKVKVKTIQTLSKLNARRKSDMILPLLLDGNNLVVIEAIKSLGNLRYEKSIPQLIKALKYSTVNVQKEICLSLGRIKSTESIPALEKVIFEKAFFFKKARKEIVRTAALWSIIQIDPIESKRICKKLKTDKNKEIRQLCSGILKDLVKKEGKQGIDSSKKKS